VELTGLGRPGNCRFCAVHKLPVFNCPPRPEETLLAKRSRSSLARCRLQPSASGEAQTFRVTHPFHPLRGRTFQLVDCRQTWGEERVYFYDDWDASPGFRSTGLMFLLIATPGHGRGSAHRGRRVAVTPSRTGGCEPRAYGGHFRSDSRSARSSELSSPRRANSSMASTICSGLVPLSW
jgi:Family of unknown function (DUF5372)